MRKLVLDMSDYLPLRDVVFNTLREAILHGTIEPGERLMEIHLAKELGVSRTPIREAIRKLELEGLVSMTPRKGAVVASITEQDLRDVLEVRDVLEQLAMELACNKMTAEGIAQLKSAMAEFRNAIHSGDTAVIAKKDVKFHDIIYAATGNNRLIQLLNNLRDQLYRYRLEYIKDESTRKKLIEEHLVIISTLENKNVEEAKKAMKEHIVNQEESILDSLHKKQERILKTVR